MMKTLLKVSAVFFLWSFLFSAFADDPVRILLDPEDCSPFSPVSFRDASGEYLRQTGCAFLRRVKIYRIVCIKPVVKGKRLWYDI